MKSCLQGNSELSKQCISLDLSVCVCLPILIAFRVQEGSVIHGYCGHV